MGRTRYLVVAELGRKGFLVGSRKTLAAAKFLMDRTYSKGNKYEWKELKKVEQDLRYFDSYIIYGNEKYISMMENEVSDGKFSVHVLRIENYNEVTIELIKKERANISMVFDWEKSIPKLQKLYDLIEHTSLVAN
ncbi:MAG: hypothetical protein GY751_06700 [Bacteroidetes bacterium]|nr:hypothetical protein [Bacteroidota bacterium]